MPKLPTVLEGIVEGRKGHLDDIRDRLHGVTFDTLLKSERSLYDSIRNGGARGIHPAFIMECKSASPSLGLIRGDYHPGDIASVYSRYAAGISVLCEPDRFGGDYDHLATVASVTHLPVLCKDFIIDEIQVYAARYFGADAILLMLSVLSDAEYAHLASLADSLGMDVLTEVIDEEEAHRATKLGAKIFGVNHRNLHDLSIDLSRSARLAELAPPGALVVSESGIRDVQTVRRLGGHSDAFLVGSQLTSQPDIDLACRELVYGPNKVCGLTSPSAAQAAKAAGAVYGGLIFEEASPRNVSRETSREIMAAEPGLKYVAVSRRTEGYADLVAGGEDLVSGECDGGAFTAVQVHAPYQGSVGEELALIQRVRAELADACGEHAPQVWRAVSMTEAHGPATAEALAVHPEGPDLLVLDAHQGGSGEGFDWGVVGGVVKQKALLAGGLTPANVGDAVAVGCVGVDLNSGVEARPGLKDAAKLRAAFGVIGNVSFEGDEDE